MLPSTTNSPDIARVAATPDTELLARIDHLERELARSLAALGVRQATPFTPPATIVTAAVDHLHVRMTSEDEATRRDAFRTVFGLSDAQVLREFGMPTETLVLQGGVVKWGYEHGDHEVWFTFANGVVQLEASESLEAMPARVDTPICVFRLSD